MFSLRYFESLSPIIFPEKIKSKLDLFKEESYSSESILQLDLGINDTDSASFMPVIRRIASFSNGYISSGKKEALIGDRLAKYLKLNIGDTLVLIGQGYHGTTAAGKFRIAGIVRMPTSDIDNKIVYLPVDVCQEFYSAPGMLTSLALCIKDNMIRR